MSASETAQHKRPASFSIHSGRMVARSYGARLLLLGRFEIKVRRRNTARPGVKCDLDHIPHFFGLGVAHATD